MKSNIKRIFLFASSALLLLASCAKEHSDVALSDDAVTFCLSTEDATSTKAVQDGDGAAAKINHWVMEVRDSDGEVYARKDESGTAGEKTHSFTVKLVKSQTYTVLFWADTKDSYNTSDLTNVTQAAGYVANKDSRDAFSAVVSDFTYTGPSSQNVTLYRPFGQLNIIFTDLADLYTETGSQAEYMKYEPCSLKVTAKIPTSFNVKTQTAGDAAATALELTAESDYMGNYSTHRAEETIFMDYFFATAGSKDVVDLGFSFYSNGIETSHTFSAVPFQRNYRTNIKGELMTSGATWNVTVDPTWEEPDIDVKYASTLAQAQEIVGTNSDNAVVVEVKQEAVTNATTDDVVTVGGKKYLQFILKTTSPKIVGFELPEITNTDYERLGADTWLVTYEPTYPTTDVTVEAPENTKVKIEAPTSHVEVTGTTYAEITASTGDNTLVVPLGISVSNLIVNKGGLEIHGTVAAASVVTSGSDKVYVRACENLIKTVYDNLEPYIDVDNGYVGEKVAENNYRIYQKEESEKVAKIGDTKYYTLNAALNAATDGQTVELVKDVTLTDLCPGAQQGSLVLINKSITLDLGTHTINCTKEPVDDSNDASAVVVISDQTITATIKNGTINTSNACNGVIISDKATLNVENLNVCQNGTKDGVKAYRNSALTVRNGGTLNVKSGNYTAEQYALFNKANGGVITVDGGTFTTKGQEAEITSSEADFPAAFRSDFATVNGNKTIINDGTFTVASGKNGASIDFGGALDNALIVNGGTFTDFVQSKYNKAEIKGGTFQSTIYKYDGGHIGFYLLSGGAFVDNVGDASHTNTSIKEGYEVEKDATEDIWRVVTLKVAKIGETKYETLASAFEAVQDGQTIELLKDCSLAASTTVDKNVTLDLKTLTLTSNVSADYLFKVASGKNFTLTNGSVADGTEGAATGLIQPTAATVTVSKVNFGTFNTAETAKILFPMTGSTSLTLTDVTVTTNNNVVKTSGENNALTVTNGTYTDTKRNGGTHTFDLLEYDTSSALFDGVTITSPDAAERQSCIETDATKGTSNIVLKNCTIKAEYGNTVYAAADMTIINCDIETADNANNAYHAVSVESEHTLNIYGGTYKGSTKANSAALKIWTSGGIIKVYDKYNEETLPVVMEGTYLFYIDSNNKGGEVHTAEVYFEGDNIQTKGQWAQQHAAKVYVKGGYHDCTVWYGSNANTFILSGGTYTMDPGTDNRFKIADGYIVVQNEGTPQTWSVKNLPAVGLGSMGKDNQDW